MIDNVQIVKNELETMQNEKSVFGNVQIKKIERENLHKVNVLLDIVQIEKKCEDKHNV